MPYLRTVGHDHSHGSTEHTQADQGLGAAFLLNSAFVLIEIVGGFYTNSVSILSDALHDFGDSLALGVAWYFERISNKRRSESYTYGYRRYSVLGAVVNALVLMGGSVLVIREAISRLSSPEPVNSLGMLGLAILGVIVNGIAFSRLHRGHSHNVEVVRLHLLEDVLGWVVVLLGALAIYFWDLTFLDPLLSLLVTTWILFQVIKRLIKSLRIILQIAPEQVQTSQVEHAILELAGVLGVHDTHLWTMDGNYHILSIHVVVESSYSLQQVAEIKHAIRTLLRSNAIEHATIEFEYPGEDCVYEDCQ